MSRPVAISKPTRFMDLSTFLATGRLSNCLTARPQTHLNRLPARPLYTSHRQSNSTAPSRTLLRKPPNTPLTLAHQPPKIQRNPPSQYRILSTHSTNPSAPSRTHDRGPASAETTQTDFAALNVLGGTPVPSFSVDVCMYDGFQLDSGLRIGNGDGVLLLGAEAFVWRPWMAAGPAPAAAAPTKAPPGKGAASPLPQRTDSIETGTQALRRTVRTGTLGGLVNAKGQWDVPDEAWGVLELVWPRPDLLIIGTGASIRPLAPRTRVRLQQLGLRLEVLDTRNAASQFNMLVVERGTDEVAAAMVPIGWGLR